MPKKHSDYLHVVCRRCGSKTGSKTIRLSERVCKLYESHWGICPSNDPPGILPDVICGICYNHLQLIEKGKPPRHVRPPFNFSAHPIATGKEEDCQCHCCSEATSFLNRFGDHRKHFAHLSDGRPTIQRPPSSSTARVCKACCAVVLDGERHVCRQRGKRCLPSFIEDAAKRCSTPPKKAKLSVDAIRRIERAGDGLTCAQSRSVKRDLRNIVELPSQRAMVRQVKERIGDYFVTERTSLHYGKKRSGANRPAIVVKCSDPIRYLQSWLGDVAKSPMRLKLMADHGRGFLKVGVQLIDCRSPLLPSTSADPMSKSANSASEQQLLVITSAPESIENARQLLTYPAMKRLFAAHDVQIVADLKLQFLISGVMLGKYKCIYCHWQAGYARSTERTFSSNLEMFHTLKTKYGGDAKKHAINCRGVEAEPIVDHPDLLRAMPPPGLHLKMGITDHCYKELMKCMSPSELSLHQAALKQFGIKKSKYHGGCFEGRATCLLLKNLPSLHMNPNERCTPIYNALVAFSAVVDSCFGLTRDPDYRYDITAFQAAWRATEMSVTPKVHYVFCHVSDYLERYEKPGVGLGIVSEQAIEASHHHFGNLFQHYPSCNTEPSEILTSADEKKLLRFGKGVRDCVIKYNEQRFNFNTVRTEYVHTDSESDND